MQIQRKQLPFPPPPPSSLPLPLPTTLLLQTHESCRAVSALHAVVVVVVLVVVVVVAGVGVADFVLVVFFARCLAKQVRLPLQVFPKSHHQQQQLTSPLSPSLSLSLLLSRAV